METSRGAAIGGDETRRRREDESWRLLCDAAAAPTWLFRGDDSGDVRSRSRYLAEQGLQEKYIDGKGLRLLPLDDESDGIIVRGLFFRNVGNPNAHPNMERAMRGRRAGDGVSRRRRGSGTTARPGDAADADLP